MGASPASRKQRERDPVWGSPYSEAVALGAGEADPMLRHLFLHVTDRCNANCGFCCHCAALGRATEAEELTLKEHRLLTGSFAGLRRIALSGGEPSLRPDLGELTAAWVELSGARWVNLPTNGSLPGRILEIAKAIVLLPERPRLVVELSADDRGEDHDRLRGFPGLYHRLAETSRLLRSAAWPRGRRPTIKLNVTMGGHNIEHLPGSLPGMLRDLRPDRWSLLVLHTEEGPIPPGELDPDQLRRTWCRLVESCGPMVRSGGLLQRAVPGVKREGLEDVLRVLAGRSPLSPCRALQEFAVIGATGDLAPCEPLARSPLGNIRRSEYGVKPLLDGRLARELRQRLVSPSGCGCTWGCAASLNALADPRRWPRMALRVLQFNLDREGADR